MVQVTAFAAVMAAALFAQVMSLGGLVMVSTVLQATAVVNVPLGSAGGQGVAAYGVSPYMVMALVLVILHAHGHGHGLCHRNPTVIVKVLVLVFLHGHVLGNSPCLGYGRRSPTW